MSIFQLENNVVKISPEVISIPEFKEIWDRDKSKEKGKAYKEIAYVYFMADYKSPYTAYPPGEREDKIKSDFIRDESWVRDDKVNAAIKKYEELQQTPTLRLLMSAKFAAEKLSEFFRTQDPEHRNYTSNLEKLGKIIESLDKLEERVKKEETNQNRVRGGGNVLARER
jgi:hypothetical protein